MRRYPRLKRSVRLRVALLAIVALLFQQTALAAYVCSLPDMPTSNAAMTAHCKDMPMTQTPNDPALCASHCAQSPISVPNVSTPQVPPPALPALLPADVQLASILPLAATPYIRAPSRRSRGASPELRFDVLLI